MGEQGVEAFGRFEADVWGDVAEDEPEVDAAGGAGLDHRELLAAAQAHVSLFGSDFNVVPERLDGGHQGVMEGRRLAFFPVYKALTGSLSGPAGAVSEALSRATSETRWAAPWVMP